MSPAGITLATRIQVELSELERVVLRLQRLLTKAIESGDDDYFDGIALNLHSFYTGVERIFEDIAREVDGAMPAGPEWHRDLLIQMSAAVKATRPAVIRSQTRQSLDDYRGLRHVVRNVYTFNLKPLRLKDLVDELPTCYKLLAEDISDFCQFLETDDTGISP